MAKTRRSSDASLVRRSQQGDRRAFGALLGRYDWRLRGLAHALLLEPGPMDAALSAAYLRAWRDVVRLQAREDVGAWLYRMTYNACIDRLRTDGRTADEAPGAGLRAGLAVLAPADRVAVVLVDREGFSIEAAARILGLTDAVLAERLEFARDLLTRHLPPRPATAREPVAESTPDPEPVAEPQEPPAPAGEQAEPAEPAESAPEPVAGSQEPPAPVAEPAEPAEPAAEPVAGPDEPEPVAEPEPGSPAQPPEPEPEPVAEAQVPAEPQPAPSGGEEPASAPDTEPVGSAHGNGAAGSDSGSGANGNGDPNSNGSPGWAKGRRGRKGARHATNRSPGTGSS